MEMTNGKTRVLYHGHTYFKNYTKANGLIHYSCTTYPKCKAFLVLDENYAIVTAWVDNHKDSVKKFGKTRNGKYIKLTS